MFIRRKPNKSGTFSVQVVQKIGRHYKVIRSIGSSILESDLLLLERQAQDFINTAYNQIQIPFHNIDEKIITDFFNSGDLSLKVVGPEIVLGPLYDAIGFGAIKNELFRDLVLSRICYPGSKLKTSRYLLQYKGLQVPVNSIYRLMDTIYANLKPQVEAISLSHTKEILGGSIAVVFYDVTTLYFEAESQDELRKTGFSKDGKHQHPQILIGLLVSAGGYPLAYEIFEGNKYEGHTLLPILEYFKVKIDLESITVVADAGLLSNQNINLLKEHKYKYILGARIKNESQSIAKDILSRTFKEGIGQELFKPDGARLILTYSSLRAKKDERNRIRGLEKLSKQMGSGKLTKQQINNRGYNKFLKLQGEIEVSFNEDKIKEDKKWDGLKGYITNTSLNINDVIENYGQLWAIEKAFRISKSDLKIRPIFHRLRKRIEAHICLCFCSYKLIKELERVLRNKELKLTIEEVIKAIASIQELTVTLPDTGKKLSRLILNTELQKIIVNQFSAKK